MKTRLSPLCLAYLALNLPAHARPPQRPLENWAQRPLAFDVNVALAGPLGVVGASVDYAPSRFVSIGGGIGANLVGPHLAGMCRARLLPLRAGALYVGAGYAQGPFEQSIATRYGILSAGVWTFKEANASNRPTPWHHWDTARWLNLEIGGEERRQNGFDARGFVGLSALLNPQANRLESDTVADLESPPAVVPIVLYLGAAFGFSL